MNASPINYFVAILLISIFMALPVCAESDGVKAPVDEVLAEEEPLQEAKFNIWEYRIEGNTLLDNKDLVSD